jgi:tetratricopeptide (TPR) repeat protein
MTVADGSTTAEAAAKLVQQGKFAEALASVKPFIDKREKIPNLYIQASKALRGLKQTKQAQEVEFLASELLPASASILTHVSSMLNADRKFEQTVTLLQRALSQGRTEPGIFIALSIALRALSKDVDAEVIETRAIETHPGNGYILARHAQELNRLQRYQDVLELLASRSDLVKQVPVLREQVERAEDLALLSEMRLAGD